MPNPRISDAYLQLLVTGELEHISAQKIPCLAQEVQAWRELVRWHRTQWEAGDDKCWQDNEKLYIALPEGYTPPQRDTTVELQNCERYIASCHDPRVAYVSPQRRIEELSEVIRALLKINKGCTDEACNIGGGLCADCSVARAEHLEKMQALLNAE